METKSKIPPTRFHVSDKSYDWRSGIEYGRNIIEIVRCSSDSSIDVIVFHFCCHCL